MRGWQYSLQYNLPTSRLQDLQGGQGLGFHGCQGGQGPPQGWQQGLLGGHGFRFQDFQGGQGFGNGGYKQGLGRGRGCGFAVMMFNGLHLFVPGYSLDPLDRRLETGTDQGIIMHELP